VRSRTPSGLKRYRRMPHPAALWQAVSGSV